MMNYLADISAADAGTMIGALIIALIGGGVIGRKISQQREVTIKDQPVRMMKTNRPVSYDQHSALDARVARIENHLDRIERDAAQQYKQLLEAGGERELRMTEFFGAGLREVHSRLDALLNKLPPASRR